MRANKFFLGSADGYWYPLARKPSKISETLIGVPWALSTCTTAGASGPLGDPRRRPRPRDAATAGAALRPRLKAGSAGGSFWDRGDAPSAASLVWSKATNSCCSRSMRSWISAALRNVEAEGVTHRRLDAPAGLARAKRQPAWLPGAALINASGLPRVGGWP